MLFTPCLPDGVVSLIMQSSAQQREPKGPPVAGDFTLTGITEAVSLRLAMERVKCLYCDSMCEEENAEAHKPPSGFCSE